MNRLRILSGLLSLALLPVSTGWADDNATRNDLADAPEIPPEAFFDRDLSVYSPAKKLQKVRNIASAIYVMTAEDIRRAGVDNLLDLFRLVPGIDVARVSAHEWAITARGFNQVFGNKILLLIDGAPVETPIFNGILWENINIPLDLIERIEFVRGPGAAIWGTRAMNGLINVITKDAFTYPHNTVSVGGGNEHTGSAYARVGEVLSENLAFQSYLKVDSYDRSADAAGKALDDNWHIITGNIRADSKPTESDRIRIVVGASQRRADFTLQIPSLSAETFLDERGDERENDRANLNVLWNHTLDDTSEVSLEWSTLYERREDFLLDYASYYSDIELRHRLRPFASHEFTYGLNVRFYNDDTQGSEILSFVPESKSLEYYRGFLHDDIALVPEILTLTLGSRFEENSQVGFRALPTARLLWSPTRRVSFWGAVSYTIGSPSRVYDDLRLNVLAFPESTTGLPALVQVTGNSTLKEERLVAYEIGAWAEPIEQLYVSLTGFYFRYDNIVNNVPADPLPILDDPTAPFILVPLPYTNELSADSLGAELSVDWKLNDLLSVTGSYAVLSIVADPETSQDKDFVEDSPKHTASFRAHLTISPSIQFDGILRSVAKRPRSGIPSYVEGDLRFAYLIQQNLDLELIGRNLFRDRHLEFGPLVFQTPLSEVERSVFVRVNYTF